MSPGGNSSDPEARARSLANLRPPTPAPPGNLRALGVPDDLLERLLVEVEDDDRDLLGALAEVAPLRDGDGNLPAADTLAVERVTVALRRWRLARRLERDVARTVEAARRGSARRAAEDRFMRVGDYARRCEASLAEALAAVGLDPASRSRLGGELAATAADLARARMARAPRAEVLSYLAGLDDGTPEGWRLGLDDPERADGGLAADDAGADGGGR